MTKSVLFYAACVIGLAAGTAQAAQFTGDIMDSGCAKSGSHASMEAQHKMGNDSAACTKACVKAGAKDVHYSNGKAYDLDDQAKPETFAGDKVQVTGTLDAKTNTIHVENIAAAK